MDSLTMADEVRFRNSPDIIDAHDHTTKSHSWTRVSDHREGATSRGRSSAITGRLQAVVNKDGLIELDLSGRDLQVIPNIVYTQLRLEVLRVNGNSLKDLNSNLAKLHKIKKLHAQKNRISSISETVGNCVHLQYLDLSDNVLNQVPRSFGMLRNVRVLRLSNNRLESLPHELGNMAALRQLELNGNLLWHIPASFQRLKSLRCLNLSSNSFDQLPLCVCSLRHLEALDLHGNQLSTLPPDISNLRSLRELSVASNRFQHVPFSLVTLQALQSLDFSSNQLRVLPQKMSHLKKLQMLIVQGNELMDLPQGLNNLQYLNASRNRFENISVVGSNSLRYLNVSHNVLENMPLGVYNLSKLQVLRLADNKIAYVSQDIVLLKKLRTLDLADNQLTNLPQVIDELEHLEVFNIQGNKIISRPHTSMPKGDKLKGGNPNSYNSLTRSHMGQPVYPKKSSKKRKTPWSKKAFFGGGRAEKSAQKSQHKSKNSSTQYTPRSTVRSRTNANSTLAAMLDSPKHQQIPNGTVASYRKPANESPTKASHHLHHKTAATQVEPSRIMNNTTLSRAGIQPEIFTSNPRSISEIIYPMTNHIAAEQPQEPSTTRTKPESASYTQTWVSDRVRRPPSPSSNAVTINEPIGDRLSLGEEDYQLVPVNVPDQKLHQLCSDAEAWLNDQLLRPLQVHRGIFKKSLNENGTLRTLQGLPTYPILGESVYEENPSPSLSPAHNISPAHHNINQTHHNIGSSHLNIDHRNISPTHYNTSFSNNPLSSTYNSVTHNPFSSAPTDLLPPPPSFVQRSPVTAADNGLLRLRSDLFRVPPNGGLYKSSVDSNVCVYFPGSAVRDTTLVTLQIERITPEALHIAQKLHPSLDLLVSVGDIVHVRTPDEAAHITPNHAHGTRVSLTIPAPSVNRRGKLHLVAYGEDGMCRPAEVEYRLHQGHISLHGIGFDGYGAILAKTKDKHKACRAMELLLKHLYV